MILESAVMNGVGTFILVLFCLGLVFLYGKNLYKLVKALKTSDWNIITIFRGVGVFFPVVGIIMGLV